MAYFDSTATTKPLDEILDLYLKINKENWYNSETMYYGGTSSNALIDKSKEVITNLLGLKNKNIIFTSGATEANNTAIYSTCNPHIGKNLHIITSLLEHPSVLNCYRDLEKKGFRVTYLEPNNEGIININDLEKAIDNETILVSIMWVSNVLGSIQPINDVIRIVKKYPRCKLHVDGVQGIGKIKPNFDINNIDFFTFTSHKLEGLKGTGCLIYNNKLFPSFLKGGHQQASIRPGTVDVPGIICLTKALQLSIKEVDNHYIHVKELYDYLMNKLGTLPFIKINKSINNGTPYIISLTFANIKGETVVHILEQDNHYVGTGSACNTSNEDSEPTLKLILKNTTYEPINTIRISLNYHHTKDDVDNLFESIKKVGNTYARSHSN